jgi:hypothetical protein
VRMVGLLGLLFLVGCTKGPVLDNAVPVHPVTGTVTFNGKPMNGAIVTFNPLNPTDKFSPSPSGVANAEGVYKLTTYNTADGAPVGEYLVTLYWPGQRRGLPNEEGDLPPDQLKEAYANKKTSKLRGKVEAKDNVVDFTITK